MKTLFMASVVVGILGGVLYFVYRTPEEAMLRTSGSVPNERVVTLGFAGDVMFDRYIRKVAQVKGNSYIFSCIHSMLHKPDIVVANLEGPITDNPSVSIGSTPGGENNFTFTFDPALADTLKEENIRIVFLGNNHVLDFGGEGMAQTRRLLTKTGIGYFGGVRPDEPTYRFLKEGISFAFIGYNAFLGGGVDDALSRIATLKGTADYLIVYAHWGQEYTQASVEVKALAHSFVDAGADLVVGSHPHVIQESELYRGSYIYYSLGNFIFDQYFSPETMEGLFLTAEFHENGIVRVEETMVSMLRDGRTCGSSD